MPTPGIDKLTYEEALNTDRKLVRATVHKYAVHDCYGALWLGWHDPPAVFEWTIKPDDGVPRPRFRIDNPRPADRAKRGFYVDKDGQSWLPVTKRGPYILNSWRVHKATGEIEVFPGAHDRQGALQLIASKRPQWNPMATLYPGPIIDYDLDEEETELRSYRGQWQEARQNYVDMVLRPDYQPCPKLAPAELPDGYDIETGLTGLPEWDRPAIVPVRDIPLEQPTITPAREAPLHPPGIIPVTPPPEPPQQPPKSNLISIPAVSSISFAEHLMMVA